MVLRVHKNLDLHNISTTVITDAEPSVDSWLWVIFAGLSGLKTYSTCSKLAQNLNIAPHSNHVLLVQFLNCLTLSFIDGKRIHKSSTQKLFDCGIKYVHCQGEGATVQNCFHDFASICHLILVLTIPYHPS